MKAKQEEEKLKSDELKEVEKKVDKIKKTDISDEVESIAKKFEKTDEPEQKYERLFQTFGHTEENEHGPACAHCVSQKKMFDDIRKSNPKIKIEEFDVYKDKKGQQYFKEKKVKVMPTTFDCPIDDDGKVVEKECVEVQGFNENHFKKYLK